MEEPQDRRDTEERGGVGGQREGHPKGIRGPRWQGRGSRWPRGRGEGGTQGEEGPKGIGAKEGEGGGKGQVRVDDFTFGDSHDMTFRRSARRIWDCG